MLPGMTAHVLLLILLFSVLFGLYANENLSSISIEKHEMDAFILATDGQVPQSLSDLFREVGHSLLRPHSLMFYTT